ncbi:aldolase/citrate lyase family protein [Clostridiaceae bacterium HSG29]|nr:aldolase/citrate lyase family protein [Clostridiaceae bacterium HSG29]
MKNLLKENLENKKASIGTFVTNPTPDLVEIIALGGFDFIVIDTEHGDLSVETTKNLVRAAEYRKITPIIRVTENSTTNILRSLDVGAHGVQVPQVNTVEDAKKAIDASKYFPIGSRGLALARSADYGNIDAFDYFKKSNNETMIVVHCENTEGFGNLEDILKLPEIDVIFLGPFDMSQSLGIPGQIYDKKIEDIANEIINLTKKYNKSAGIFVTNAEEANKRIKQGFKYVTIQMFDTFILNACKSEISKIIK